MHRNETLYRLTVPGLLLLLAAQFLMPVQAAPLALENLFELMAKQARVSTTFTEQKTVRGLDAPVESSGELLFEAPSRLVKRTLKPQAETLTLDGRHATVVQGLDTRTVSLDDHPALAIHVEGLRACLAGDRAALERLYHVSLSGSLTQWKMTLVPRDAQAAEQVEAIFLGGEQAEIRIVEVLLSNGNTSLTRISHP